MKAAPLSLLVAVSMLSVGFTKAEYAAKVKTVKARIAKKAPTQTFHVVIQPPFVVIGDESETRVKQRARSTVKWASDRLEDAYFAKPPKDILEVWLFKNKSSYERNTMAFWNEEPDTPFGYYSAADGALVMNIATGGGTLVHEIVHPYMESNYPECPSWLNEGLGSLYEQSSQRDGDIIGLTNWRLAGLQDAIRAKTVPSFKTLMSTSEYQFYSKDPGTNYAQSRYLLYYLQEQGLLHEFYKDMHANRKTDPTGYKTLKRTLGKDGKDMGAFQKKWQRYVMKLSFP